MDCTHAIPWPLCWTNAGPASHRVAPINNKLRHIAQISHVLFRAREPLQNEQRTAQSRAGVI